MAVAHAPHTLVCEEWVFFFYNFLFFITRGKVRLVNRVNLERAAVNKKLWRAAVNKKHFVRTVADLRRFCTGRIHVSPKFEKFEQNVLIPTTNMLLTT